MKLKTVLYALLVLLSSTCAAQTPKKDGMPTIRVLSVSDSYVGVVPAAKEADDDEEEVDEMPPARASSAAPNGKKPRKTKAAPKLPTWNMQIGDGLVRQTLARWSSVAGWQFEWDVPYDFPVTLEAEVQGTFEQAIEVVMRSLLTSDRPVQAVMYEQNKTLRIVPYRGNPSVGN